MGHDFDLVVVGGGAAGLAAARTSRRRGATVAMVTEGPPGGDCTFVGCVPSKTLIAAAADGLAFPAAMERVRATVARVAAAEDAEVLRSEGIEVITGRAAFVDRRRLRVDGRVIRARRVVVATGSRPAVPPIAGLDSVEVLTNENVFDLTRSPGSLLVVGGGPIGAELGQAFARLGVAVTVVEAGPRVLAREEPEASAIVTTALRADGVRVVTGRQVARASAGPDGATLTLDDGSSVTAARVLVAVGRTPVTVGLDLERVGVALDQRGYVATDAHLRTNVEGIYAVGDVTGLSPFTHAADEMGRIAAGNALARVAYRRFHPDRMPAVTYTDPEVARVGCTEQQAAAIDGARVAYVPLTEVDRAVTTGRTDGYLKLIAAPRRGLGNLAGGRLVGATVVAAPAGEMLAAAALALQTAMFPARLALTVQPYPTWSLAIRQAAGQFFVESAGRRARPARPGG
ncbi:MAG TPA: FAD-dependent oxidoreductase [Acidimicrobiales bacterium]|nr:FAD-dependent oxidoreductase [Acidimicrobiales bacterium]